MKMMMRGFVVRQLFLGRRICLLFVSALWCLSSTAWSQSDFPNRSITFIVPQSAAGSGIIAINPFL